MGRIVQRNAGGLAGIILWACAAASGAQSVNDLSTFVGRWQIDLSRTKMGRMGPNGKNLVRSPTFTFVFATEGEGLRMDVYSEYPGQAPSRTTPIIPDQKPRPCENKNGCQTVGGDPKEQTFTYFRIDSHLLGRIFYINGEPAEYTTYAVSGDAKTFTMITWSAETPQYQNIQVFERQP
jgi:hypothetical protein